MFAQKRNHEEVLTEIRLLRGLFFALTRKVEKMALDVSGLKAELAVNTSLVGSVESLIQTLASEAGATAGDQAALDTFVAQLKANDTSIAAAVVANTPAAPGVPTGTGAAPTGSDGTSDGTSGGGAQ